MTGRGPANPKISFRIYRVRHMDEEVTANRAQQA
jgi:hypothetical protein